MYINNHHYIHIHSASYKYVKISILCVILREHFVTPLPAPARTRASARGAPLRSCTSKGIGRQGVGSFYKDIPSFDTVPCHPMPLCTSDPRSAGGRRREADEPHAEVDGIGALLLLLLLFLLLSIVLLLIITITITISIEYYVYYY